jgi:ABC-type phosphate transport system substrate-binding protein|nr:hypothetical protein [Kofleriaceae bacterium]
MTPTRIVIALVAACTLACGLASSDAHADGYALVANASGAPGSLAKSDVRALYTGKAKTFANTVALVVVRGDADATFGQFADDVFGISAKTLLAKIKQEVFKGEMPKPVKAASDDEVIEAVAGTPGTLGVVSAAAAGHLPKTVTVIRIGG